MDDKLGQRRILAVDDDRLIREMTRDALEAEGFVVETAASATRALELMAETPFHLVITDLSMQEMDGLELLERIRRRHPATDVVVLTGNASLESAQQAMQGGAVDYLRKPAQAEEMVHCVRRALLRRTLMGENESLRGAVQAYEASRGLMTCLETNDVLPLALDVLLRLVGRRRAVGRLIQATPRPSDGTYLAGFTPEESAAVREEVESGKHFDALELAHGAQLMPLSSPELEALGLADEPMMALPLRMDRRVVGGLWALADGDPFSDEELSRGELVRAQAELALANADRFLQAREKAFIDDVTDLYNARYLLAALDREVKRAERADTEMSVLFLDLDRFKLVNDNHGHLVGSRVLREFGQLLYRSVRSIDTAARYGGDEFSIILVDTGLEGAQRVAERIRNMAETTRFSGGRDLGLSITCSVGVATFPCHGGTRDELLDQADKAMYLGKSRGRNHVCTADDLR